MYSLKAKIEKLDYGKYFYAVAYLSDDLVVSLNLEKLGRLRVKGFIDLVDMEWAWNPNKGRWYVILSKKFLANIGKAVGDYVQIEFEPLADQEKIDLPPELHDFLSTNEELKTLWEKLTPGKKRQWSIMVSKAKTGPTIEKRLLELREFLEVQD